MTNQVSATEAVAPVWKMLDDHRAFIAGLSTGRRGNAETGVPRAATHLLEFAIGDRRIRPRGHGAALLKQVGKFRL